MSRNPPSIRAPVVVKKAHQAVHVAERVACSAKNSLEVAWFNHFGYLVVAFLVIAGMRMFHAAEKGTHYAVVLIVETFETGFMCVVRNNQEGLNQIFITTAVIFYARCTVTSFHQCTYLAHHEGPR